MLPGCGGSGSSLGPGAESARGSPWWRSGQGLAARAQLTALPAAGQRRAPGWPQPWASGTSLGPGQGVGPARDPWPGRTEQWGAGDWSCWGIAGAGAGDPGGWRGAGWGEPQGLVRDGKVLECPQGLTNTVKRKAASSVRSSYGGD